ncbi:DNA gyrase subunit A [Candidatus Heimdallarchaeota archaeon B3_Heim]|nr:MAG: DNA gyrase subunit A [Candidatus Heimdallarchaeota archaeon B3_Heim]
MSSNIKITPIEKTMAKSYLEYSMSVITSRALPHVRDGLKPVHRRILWAMYNLGLTHNRPPRKCARTIGETSAKYHPHGGNSVYDALVRMAQPFSLRYPLIQGQGNFGSMDGQPAAAMRYTEARMAEISNEILMDINKNTVDLVDNFDGLDKEPVILPAKIPNLLVNGVMGIAVGMATSMPPHNLGEVLDGVKAVIEDPEISIVDLMKYIPGPDFPTGGVIFGTKGIKRAYHTGTGNVVLRAKYEFEEKKNKTSIVITEVPYLVKRQDTIEHRGLVDIIERMKEAGKFPEIGSVKNESNIIRGTRIVINLKHSANIEVVLNRLFKFTPMQISFSIRNMVLVDAKVGDEVKIRPKNLNLKELLTQFIDHRHEIIVRRTEFDLKKARERAHILEGRKIVVENLDEVIKIIRGSSNGSEAQTALISKFLFSEIQAKDILALPLRSLTRFDRDKILQEYKETLEAIKDYEDILGSEQRIIDIIVTEIDEIKSKYGDPRRSNIVLDDSDSYENWTDKTEEDFITKEDIVITLTSNGYIKSISTDMYNSQHRGGKGIKSMDIGKDDFLQEMIVASTHDTILFFTVHGTVYRFRGFQIPMSKQRVTKGVNIVNLLKMDRSDKIVAIIRVTEFNPDHYLVLATKNGIIKKSSLSEYENIRSTGIIAQKLRDNDMIIGAKVTDGTKGIILATKKGKAIRFKESDVRVVGRSSIGVMGIRLNSDDSVIDLAIVDENRTLLTICENGYGKRSTFDKYRITRRNGKGVINIKATKRNGDVIAVKSVNEKDLLLMVANDGKLIQIPLEDIRAIGRATSGVTLMRLEKDSGVKISSVAIIAGGNSNQGVD